MEIILLERVEKLGQMGDQVNVKNGYARNYLLPFNKAVRATKANIEEFENRKHQLETENLESRKEAESVAKKMDGVEALLIRQASESGQLYGSVSARDIADQLSQDGFSVNKNQVKLDRPVKTIGIFDYEVKLHPEVMVTISVNVAQSEEEGKAQSERKSKGQEVVVTAASLIAEADAEALAEQAKEMAKNTFDHEEDAGDVIEEFVEDAVELAQFDETAEDATTSEDEGK